MESIESLVQSLENIHAGGYLAYKYLYMRENEVQAKGLCISAGIVSEIVDYYYRNNQSFSTYGTVDSVSNWLKENRRRLTGVKYLPLNRIRLMMKVRAVGVYGIPLNQAIKLPRYGNRNSARPETAGWWKDLAQKMATGSDYGTRRRYTQSEIFQSIRELSAIIECPAPSSTTIRTFLRGLKTESSESWAKQMGYHDFTAVAQIAGTSYQAVFQLVMNPGDVECNIRAIAKDYYEQRQGLINQLINKYRK